MRKEHIRCARLTLGLTQSEMGKALGLTSKMTYAKWEQGKSKPTSVSIAAIEMLLYMQSCGVICDWLNRHTQGSNDSTDMPEGL